MARPKIEIDFSYLEEICQRPISAEDVAAILGISKDTLERAIKSRYKCSFAAFKDKKMSGIRLRILDAQLNTALGVKNPETKQWEFRPNVKMLIWLGKQYCGQKDKTEISNDQAQPFTLAYTLNDLKKVNENE